MKSKSRTGVVFVVPLLMFVISYVWSGASGATQPVAGDRVTVEGRVVTDDLLTAGQIVRVRAEVQGDLVAAGSEVTITGPVNGYVMSVGRTVRLDGRIGNDLWAAGETVDVDGRIGDNVRAAGRTVHLHPGTAVGHDAHLAGEIVTAQGRIDRNLSIGAATARIGADVGGTVEVRAERVTVQPGAVIRGDLVVRAPQPPEVSPQARVEGDVRFHQVGDDRGWLSRRWLWVLCFPALLILGLATVAFSPAWAGRVAGTMKARPGASVLAGLIVLVLTPIIAGVLLMTVIGVPLALVLLALYAVVLLLSGVFVSYRTGTWLLDRMHRARAPQWGRMVVGVLVVSLGMFLPVVGWIVVLAVLITGAGALALERRSLRTELGGAGR